MQASKNKALEYIHKNKQRFYIAYDTGDVPEDYTLVTDAEKAVQMCEKETTARMLKFVVRVLNKQIAIPTQTKKIINEIKNFKDE